LSDVDAGYPVVEPVDLAIGVSSPIEDWLPISRLTRHGIKSVPLNNGFVRQRSPGEGYRSLSSPTAHGPVLAVMRTPHFRSAMRRVKTRLMGVWK